MKKVAIIGGGIAGLTAAYRLSQKGIECILFEESSYTGGRIEYCVSITTPSFQPRLYELAIELGLEDAKVPFPPSLIGMLLGKAVLDFEEFPKMIERLSDAEKAYNQRLMGEVMGNNFDIFNPSPRLLELRNISFEEYLKECPLNYRKMFVEPMMSFAFMESLDLTKFSAEYGLFHIRFAMEMMSPYACTFEENVKTITSVLEKKAGDLGSEILLSSKVVKIEQISGGFRIQFEKGGEIGAKEAEKVVLAVPLLSVKRVFPQIDVGKSVFYESTRCFLVRGKLKTTKQVLMGMPHNEANVRFLFVAYPGEHQVYPMEKEKPVNFEVLYDNYEILGQREIESPFPIIAPAGKVPDLQSGMDGVYLCGDFHYYPTINSAVRTAEKVAEMITKER